MIENKNRRILNKSYRPDYNKIKISSANTFQHEIIKTIVATYLINKGHEVVTEAIFNGSGRADVFDLSTGVVYEILHSESEETFKAKKHRYPQEVMELIPIKTEQFKNHSIEQIKKILDKELF